MEKAIIKLGVIEIQKQHFTNIKYFSHIKDLFQ